MQHTDLAGMLCVIVDNSTFGHDKGTVCIVNSLNDTDFYKLVSLTDNTPLWHRRNDFRILNPPGENGDYL